MRSGIVAFVLAFLALAANAQTENDTAHIGLTNSSRLLKEGDLVFVQSHTENAAQITQVTGSRLTHCGIVFGSSEGWVVFEGAGQPEFRSLEKWQKEEADGHVEPVYVHRLKNRDEILTADKLKSLRDEASKLHKTNYDFAFAWNNSYVENRGRRDEVTKEYVYCSELLYKAFERALGLRLGTPHAIKDYYAGLPEQDADKIKAKLKDDPRAQRCRNGNAFNPEDPAISPVEVFASELLEDVKNETAH
jgi:hypothetical protein